MTSLLDRLRQQHYMAAAVVFGIVAIIGIVVGLTTTGWDFPLLLFVFLSGTLGGTINHFRRLQAVSPEETPSIGEMDRPMVRVQALVSPVIGGVFAVVLYVIFIAGILQGSFFPTFTATDTTYRFVDDLFGIRPATTGDAAKTIFWGFVAGFSEWFVPNILDKVASEQREHERSGKD